MKLDPSLTEPEQLARNFLVSQIMAVINVVPGVAVVDVRRVFESIAGDDELWRALPLVIGNLCQALPGIYAQTELELQERPRGAFANLQHAHVSPRARADTLENPPQSVWPGPGPEPGDGSGSKGGLS